MRTMKEKLIWQPDFSINIYFCILNKQLEAQKQEVHGSLY